MQHFVLGTAGHVDHGKTSLIKALTGVDTDRLREEKERGITIELGFASLAFPSGLTLGIVDVPGHEKFIKHMVAGAAGIDLVLMVIAADEGVMPQTREHLHICSLLGIKTGLVALTKIDLVEEDWLELVRSEISDYLKDTFLAGAPIIPVSAAKETGMVTLMAEIEKMVSRLKEKADDGIFRLPVDRIFTMKGFGTVVTGTLISDKIKVGEEIQILPENIAARIRGIQVHNFPVEEAFSGQRTAINLQGIEKSTLARGNVLVRPQTIWPTTRLDVVFEYLGSNTRKLKNRALVRLHTGTTEIMTRIVLLDTDELSPGDQSFAQLILSEEDVAVAGDHFVLRSYSPVTTIGGGVILDPLPVKHKRKNRKILDDFNILQNGELPEKISVLLERAGFAGMSIRMLAFRLGISAKKIRESLEKLFSSRMAVLMGGDDFTALSFQCYTQLEERMLQSMTEYHSKNPLKEGMPREELKAALHTSVTPKLFNMALLGLGKRQAIISDKDYVRIFSHSVQLAGEEDRLRQSISTIYTQAGLTPPSLVEVQNSFGESKAKAQNIVKLMLRDGELVKINEDMCFSRIVLDKLRKDYKEQLSKDGKATPATFKDLTGLSRKYIIPLMEYFDVSKLTVRVGDHRILREKPETNP
jgi:selenocysteine-specific elongation factor